MLHECTSKFSREVFVKWLPRYHILRPMVKNQEALLSPHQFAWPVYRPRLYTVLINLETMEVPTRFNETLELLYRKCVLDVSALFAAPKERWCVKLCKVKTVKA